MRIASVNVNGIRAAFTKGMGTWLEDVAPDVLSMQEVRAQDEHLAALLPTWNVVHDEASQKGRAGVAIASRVAPVDVRTEIGAKTFDTAGRWIEADFATPAGIVTVVSVYVHSGEVGSPKQEQKMKFLAAMAKRLPQLRAHSDYVAIMGDFNVGHTERDIKNWKGNRKNAGFLPEERSYLDRFFGAEGKIVTATDGVRGKGHGWVDVGRRFHGDVEGPYTWWSQRGKAFDTDTGWRIDYQMVSPALGETVTSYKVDKASAWDTRWSDHAPVIVDYDL